MATVLPLSGSVIWGEGLNLSATISSHESGGNGQCHSVTIRIKWNNICSNRTTDSGYSINLFNKSLTCLRKNPGWHEGRGVWELLLPYLLRDLGKHLALSEPQAFHLQSVRSWTRTGFLNSPYNSHSIFSAFPRGCCTLAVVVCTTKRKSRY